MICKNIGRIYGAYSQNLSQTLLRAYFSTKTQRVTRVFAPRDASHSRKGSIFDTSPSALISRVSSLLKDPAGVPENVLLQALESCKKAASSIEDGKQKTLLLSLAKRLTIASGRSNSVVKSYLILDPVPEIDDAIEALPRAVKSATWLEHLAYIPLRNALMQKDLDGAFRIYDAHAKTKTMPLGSLAAMTALGTAAIAELAMSAIIDLPMTAAIAVLASTTAASAFAAATSATRVRWNPRISIGTRMANRHQLLMVERIVTGFDEFIDTNATNFHKSGSQSSAADAEPSIVLKNELRKRGFNLVAPPVLAEYEQYWKSAGQGYSWVEPDQDPADKWTNS